MAHRRSPARFLAPLALVLAALTIYLVARPELERSSSKPETTTAAQTRSETTAKKRTTARKTRKTYTVKPGDVLGSISESTGIPVADLQDYNDIDDAQSLRPGQKLKLTP